MTRPRANQRLVAAAHLVENLAALATDVRQHVAVEMRHIDGYAAKASAAGPEERSTPARRSHASDMDRWCTVDVPSDDDPDEFVDCGKPRPCPDHDGPVELTAVERAAGERMRLEQRYADFVALLDGLALMTAEATAAAHSLLGHRAAIDVPRCSSTGRDGAIEWADPTCSAVPSRGPLCDRCAKREYRWRSSRGLTQRADGVFSAEAS